MTTQIRQENGVLSLWANRNLVWFLVKEEKFSNWVEWTKARESLKQIEAKYYES